MGVDEEIDSMMGQSLSDLKEMQEMQGLYRQNGNPNLNPTMQNSSDKNFYKP